MDLREKLKAAGIPMGGEWVDTVDGPKTMPQTLAEQRALLESLRGLIRVQVETDKNKVAELHETLSRIKHGGGR